MRRAPLEKAVAIPGRDGGPALDGIYLGEADMEAGALIAPPHPLYGGSMDNPVVSEVSFAASRAGLATLRFDWRGIGGSAGTPSGEAEDADADYGAALDHLAETVEGPLVACGYSFGAAAALRAASATPRVRRLVLIAPPPALCDPQALAGFAGSLLAVAGARDAIAPARGVEAIVSRAPKGECVVIPDADHFFASGLAAVGRAVAEFLG